LHSLFFTVFQLRVYIYISILIQPTLTTLSNTVHSNYFSRPTNTAKLFLKLKRKLQHPQIYSSKSFSILLCRWQTNAPTNKHKRSLYNSRNVNPLFAPHICAYVQCAYIRVPIFRQSTVDQELTINVPSQQSKLKSEILYISPTIRCNKFLLTILIGS